jgi:hypothetical protein
MAIPSDNGLSPLLLGDVAYPSNADVTYLLRQLERVELLLSLNLSQVKEESAGPRGVFLTEDVLQGLLNRPEPPKQEVQFDAFLQAYAEVESEIEHLVEEATGAGQGLRFVAMVRNFHLSPLEQDLFLMILAPLLDARYGRIMSYLNDDITQRYPTVNTALGILLPSLAERIAMLPHFFGEGRLFANRLIRRIKEGAGAVSLNEEQLMVEESVVAWLLGTYQPHASLAEYVKLRSPQVDMAARVLTSEIWPTMAQAINGQSVAVFAGHDHGAQRAAADLLAANLELNMLDVDLPAALKAHPDPLEVMRLLDRDATMTQSILFLRGWDQAMSQSPAQEMAQLLFKIRMPVILGCTEPWYAYGIVRQNHMMHIRFERPSFRQRQKLWDFFLDQIEEPKTADVDVLRLASQFALDSSQIRDAAFSAQDAAVQRGEAITHWDLVTAARIHSSPNLSGLAQKIEPRYDWEDIVLPPEQKIILREVIDTVRGRGIVMEEWGVGRKLKTSSGVAVLFAGPPGTGKTMSAEVIAKALGLDLYKIDLSTVVSKYIGETEKNLGRIFDEAQSSSAVLFFDEADSVFGKRSEVKDAHDRYANMEVSYLLQRMEQYDGITILATNLRANMDEAFTRRMQFIIDYPFPDETERLHIWRTLFPSDLPQGDDIDLELLATRFKLAGGNIRNVIASAAFLAASNGGVVTMAHLIHGTRREMQKMGRLISDMDLSF